MLKASWLCHVGMGAHTVGGPRHPLRGSPQLKPARQGRDGAGGKPASRIDPRWGQADRHMQICHPSSPASAAAGELDGTQQHHPTQSVPGRAPSPGSCPGSGCYSGNRYGGRGRRLREGDPRILLPSGSSLATQGCSASLLGPALAGPFRSYRYLSHGSSAPLFSPSLKSLGLQGWIFLSLSSPSGRWGWTIS